MFFGLFGVGAPRLVYFVLILRLGGPTEAGGATFLGRGLLRIRSRRLGGRAVGGCIGPVKEMRLMCIVLSTLLTLLLLLLYSFVDVSSLLRMCLRVSGTRDLLLLGGMLFWVTGRVYVVMVRVVLSLP